MNGLFTGKVLKKLRIFQSSQSSYLVRLPRIMLFFWFYIKKIILSSNVETNFVPQSKRYQECSILHWNLNNIATHSFLEVSLLKACITIYKYHIIFLSETYLDSSILCDDNNLEIPDYGLGWADHWSNIKRGRVCVYCRNSLPLEVRTFPFFRNVLILN